MGGALPVVPMRLVGALYRGTPVVLVVPTSRLNDRTHVDMSPIVARLGAKRIDRYLRSCGVAEPGIALGVTPDKVYLEAMGEGAATVEPVSSEVREKAIREGEVLVLVVDTVRLDDDIEEHVRLLSGQGRVYGAKVPVVDANRLGIWSHASSIYKLVGIGPEEVGDLVDPHRHTYHLDSNVVLDMERAHRGQLSPDSSRYVELQRMVARLLYEEVRIGMAIAELSLVQSTGEIRRDRQRGLIDALDAWWSHGLGAVVETADMSTRSSASATNKFNINEESEGFYRSIWQQNIIVAYASLLKLNELWAEVDGFKEKQRLSLFAEYCDWTANELGRVSAYALQVAADLLVGEKNAYARSLLKFSQRRQQNLVGAAWDIAHLTSLDAVYQARFVRDTEGLHSDVAGDSKGTPVLITGDQAILALREYLQAAGTLNDKRYGFSKFYPHKLLMHRADDIRNSFDVTLDAALNRAIDGKDWSEQDYQRWQRLVRMMENRL